MPAFPTLVPGPDSSNEGRGISVEFNETLGDITLSPVTAYRAFDTYDRIDGDFTNVDVLERINEAEQTSISPKFRLTGNFETVVGGTCQDQFVFHTGQPNPDSGGHINAEVCDRSGGVIPYNQKTAPLSL